MDENDPTDRTADTDAFRAFADAEAPPERSATSFRVLTLVGGLVVLAGLVWLLLR